MDFRETHSELDHQLHSAVPDWQPSVFNDPMAPWLDHLPALQQQLLALDDASLHHWQADDEALLRGVSPHYPAAKKLLELIQRVPNSHRPLEPLPDRWSWHMPGRKWQQIRYFTQQLAPLDQPIVEWCSGKAHLSRLINRQWSQPALALERDSTLVASGHELAKQNDLPIEFRCCDVLQDHTDEAFASNKHGVALHACGELHRHFLRQTLTHKPARVSLAPCCYNLGGPPQWQPLSQFAKASHLQPRTGSLKLAVRQTVTADQREQNRHRQKQQWRLGFNAFWREATGQASPPQLNMQRARRAKRFEDFAEALLAEASLAAGESTPPAPSNWQVWAEQGAALYERVQRLELISMMYRRPLELWLVLDYAIALQEAGYRVKLTQFSPQHITPRNLLVDARR